MRITGDRGVMAASEREKSAVRQCPGGKARTMSKRVWGSVRGGVGGDGLMAMSKRGAS